MFFYYAVKCNPNPVLLDVLDCLGTYFDCASENEINARVYFLNAPELYPLKHSEEHMVVYAGKAHKFKIGDMLYALPIHICPTVALYEKAYCIQFGNLKETWDIAARDRMINH